MRRRIIFVIKDSGFISKRCQFSTGYEPGLAQAPVVNPIHPPPSYARTFVKNQNRSNAQISSCRANPIVADTALRNYVNTRTRTGHSNAKCSFLRRKYGISSMEVTLDQEKSRLVLTKNKPNLPKPQKRKSRPKSMNGMRVMRKLSESSASLSLMNCKGPFVQVRLLKAPGMNCSNSMLRMTKHVNFPSSNVSTD